MFVLLLRLFTPAAPRALKFCDACADKEVVLQPAQTVLVIDDDAAFAYFVASIIHCAEYCTAVATDGAEGLRLARSILPALVLCDLSMSGLDGVQVLQMLRDDPITANVPRILMSGFVRPDLRAIPADAFIAKPVDTPSLRRLVRAFTKPRAIRAL